MVKVGLINIHTGHPQRALTCMAVAYRVHGDGGFDLQCIENQIYVQLGL